MAPLTNTMAALAVLLPAAVLSIAPRGKYYHLQQYLSSRSALQGELLGKGEESSPPPSLRFFTQRQDHFDGSNPTTWQQAYYVNDTFWKGPESNAPVFLCVGGEGPPLTPAVVVNSVHCSNAVDWLQETGALFFAVEHRYYGCHNTSACPVQDFKDPPTKSLHYLSSRQALADLAQFHSFATKEYSLSSSNKWVSFGGSYPGMLAGWFRVKFPHLVHAAVASSAPVHPKVEMSEYNDWVRYAYTVESVGGSEACSQNIADGHATIGTLFGSDEGRTRLASLFQLPSADWLKERANQRDFAGEGVAYFPSQGNDPACTMAACNIERICAIMTDDKQGDNVSRLQRVRASQSEWVEAAQKQMHKEASSGGYRDFADYWGWQTCTEFGFYQTCDVGSKCPYTQGLDLLNDQIKMCQESFNISAETVAANVEFSNVYYGSLAPVASRILWPNGEVDPWSTLSILKSPSEQQPTLWVKGASHHAWTHETLPSDQPSVEEARLAIRKQVTTWLDEEGGMGHFEIVSEQ
eukprot:jgi/Bigna1/87275/estExt_fgenesh1_pg.C_180145